MDASAGDRDDGGRDGTDRDDGGRGTVRWLFWNDRERRLRAPWRLLAAVVLSALIVLAVGAVFVVAVPRPEALGGPYAPAVLSAVQTLSVMVALVAALLVAARVVDHRWIGDLGLQLDGDWWADFGFGLALGLAMATVAVGAQLVAGMARVTGTVVQSTGDLVQFGGAPFWLGLVLVLVVFVGVAVSEEVLIRGYLLTNVAEGLDGLGPLDARGAILASSGLTAVLFGVLHAANPNASFVSIANISLVGLFFAATYVLTDRIAIATGIHLTWNAAIGSLYGQPVSGIDTGATVLAVEERGPDWVTGGAFGPEAGVVTLLAVLVGTALLLAWVRRRYGDVGIRESVALPALRTDGAVADAPEAVETEASHATNHEG